MVTTVTVTVWCTSLEEKVERAQKFLSLLCPCLHGGQLRTGNRLIWLQRYEKLLKQKKSAEKFGGFENRKNTSARGIGRQEKREPRCRCVRLPFYRYAIWDLRRRGSGCLRHWPSGRAPG